MRWEILSIVQEQALSKDAQPVQIIDFDVAITVREGTKKRVGVVF
jgi:hypothetical protein